MIVAVGVSAVSSNVWVCGRVRSFLFTQFSLAIGYSF